MAVGYDATAAPADGNSLSWTHTPSGTPRAVVVFAYYTTFDTIGFTYGGVAMTQVSGPTDQAAGGELTFSRVGVWLLDNVASGAQTVASTGGTAVIKSARSYTLTAGGVVEFIDDVIFDSAAVANPSGTVVSAGRAMFVAQVFASGQDAATGVTPLTGWTSEREVDSGTNIRGESRYNTIGTADVTVGWTQTSEDAFGVAAGFSEVPTVYSQSVAGTITPTGALSSSAIFARALTGALTPTGSLVKQTLKSVAGALTPAGAVSKQTSKAFSGVLTPTGAATKTTNKSFTGALTPTGALTTIIAFTQSVAGALTTAGTLVKQTFKNVVGALTPFGTASKQTSKTVAGQLTPTAGVSKQTSKSVSGSVTPTGDPTTSLATAQSASGALSFIGTLATLLIPFVPGGVVAFYRRTLSAISQLRHNRR